MEEQVHTTSQDPTDPAVKIQLTKDVQAKASTVSPTPKLSVTVFGDHDPVIVTHYGQRFVRDRLTLKQDARDAEIPSGVEFVAELLHQACPNTGVTPVPFDTPSNTVHLVKLGHFDDGSHPSAIRVREIVELSITTQEAANRTSNKLSLSSEGEDICVALDADAGLRRNFDEDHCRTLRRWATSRPSTSAPLIIALPRSLPSLKDYANSKFWHTISTAQFAIRPLVVVGSNVIRREGGNLSRRLSWEQTIEDVADEVATFAPLQELCRHCDVLIRFGIAGAALVQDHDGTSVRLYYNPIAEYAGIVRDAGRHGDIIGKNTLLIAGIITAVSTRSAGTPARDSVHDGIKLGLLLARHAFRNGYSIDRLQSGGKTKATRAEALQELLRPMGRFDIPSSTHSDYLIRTPTEIVTLVPSNIAHGDCPKALVVGRDKRDERKWQLSDHFYSKNDVAGRVAIAEAIVHYGIDHVVNKHPVTPDVQEFLEPKIGDRCKRPVYAPVVRFGKLTVTNRRELESLHSIQNLFDIYLDDLTRVRPLSIAVFGPPGSGKSFAVKQVLKSCDPFEKKTELLEYNLSQFEDPDDIEGAINAIRDANIRERTPLVFFDEFDCTHRSERLAWLKIFLAPMQDGKFHGRRYNVTIGRAIFVFAGGTSHSFQAFSPLGRERDEGKTESFMKELGDFRHAKGPDFVSRLRGYIDIASLNPDESGSTGDIRATIPYIRRAILLRSLLELKGFIHDGVAAVDPDIVYAMLTVSRYQHGARSIEAVLDMSAALGRSLLKASLPAPHHLAMHLDATEFRQRMIDNRQM